MDRLQQYKEMAKVDAEFFVGARFIEFLETKDNPEIYSYLPAMKGATYSVYMSPNIYKEEEKDKNGHPLLSIHRVLAEFLVDSEGIIIKVRISENKYLFDKFVTSSLVGGQYKEVEIGKK